MTGNVSLSDLSFESNEVLNLDVDPSDSYGQVPDIQHLVSLESAERVLDVYSNIVKRGSVCRDDIAQVEGLAEDFPSLRRLLHRYPVASFSAEASKTNYDVSTENFVKTAYEAVIRALREILRFLGDNFKRLWKFLTENSQRTAAVDDLQDKLKGIQLYIVDVDRIMSETPVAEQFKAARKAVFESERHNVSKGWNEFREMVVTNPAGAREFLDVCVGVLQTQVAPFAEAVDTFLGELSRANTASEVQTAIARMELFAAPSGPLVALASRYGFRPGQVRIADNMTPFHANATYIKSVFRSWTNHRIEMAPEAFANAVVGLGVESWGPVVAEAVRVSGAKTERLIKDIDAFDNASLKPGMEDAYSTHLVPFFKALLSIIQGFTILENCLGELIATRDNAVIAISKASLNIAKNLDQFVRKNGDHITIGGKTMIASRRRAIISAMS